MFELYLELETLVQKTVSECLFKNDIYWLLIFYWKIICTQKINQMCQKTQFFNFLEYDDIAVCTLHLLCVFISIVEKFKSFNAGQKIFRDKNLRIYDLWKSS